MRGLDVATVRFRRAALEPSDMRIIQLEQDIVASRQPRDFGAVRSASISMCPPRTGPRTAFMLEEHNAAASAFPGERNHVNGKRTAMDVLTA